MQQLQTSDGTDIGFLPRWVCSLWPYFVFLQIYKEYELHFRFVFWPQFYDSYLNTCINQVAFHLSLVVGKSALEIVNYEGLLDTFWFKIHHCYSGNILAFFEEKKELREHIKLNDTPENCLHQLFLCHFCFIIVLLKWLRIKLMYLSVFHFYSIFKLHQRLQLIIFWN